MAILNSVVEGARSSSPYTVALAALLAYPLFCVVYNLFFHPLRSFPGPKTWTATRLTFIISLVKGNLPIDTWKLHEKYGNVVRIAPNELSFASPEAFDDILAVRHGNPPFPRSPIMHKRRPDQKVDSIVSAASPAAHSRLRKAIAPAFTDKALVAQEPLIQRYIDFFIQRLTEETMEGSKSGIVNMLDWYSYITFDIVGDLGFGESFGCLEDKALHPWIKRVLGWFKAAAFITITQYFPLLELALTKAIPKSLLNEQREHQRFASDKIERRMKLETMHNDFFTSILEQKEGRGLSINEIEETANVIILGGSETTTTTLSGITAYLAYNRDIQQKLATEVRSMFSSIEEINISSVMHLKYLYGVIQEGLRICNPVPFALTRIVPKGGNTVCNHWIPEGTIVTPHGRALGLSSKFWARPLSFAPERWLDAPERPSEFDTDNREALKPFSVGPRSCIGKKLAMAEMSLILARLVWTFDLEAVGEPVDWLAQKIWFIIVKEPVMVKLTYIRE